jgi:hypothetical protein
VQGVCQRRQRHQTSWSAAECGRTRTGASCRRAPLHRRRRAAPPQTPVRQPAVGGLVGACARRVDAHANAGLAACSGATTDARADVGFLQRYAIAGDVFARRPHDLGAHGDAGALEDNTSPGARGRPSRHRSRVRHAAGVTLGRWGRTVQRCPQL